MKALSAYRISGVAAGGASGLLPLVPNRLMLGSLGNDLFIPLELVDGLVEDIVVLEAFTDEEVTEDVSQVRVVGFVIKAEGTSVVEIDAELVKQAAAEVLGRGSHLLLYHAVVILL